MYEYGYCFDPKQTSHVQFISCGSYPKNSQDIKV